MPWSSADAKGKTSKADTPHKQKKWAEIANGELKRCEKKGEGDCEGRAIRVANEAIAAMKEGWEQEFEQWFQQQDDETQGLLVLHEYGLKSALRAERELRKEAERRLKEPKKTALEGDFVALTEKSVRKDGTIPVKIIGPGWGNSGYYSPEVLERDGPRIFTAGTKMFWDHPTPTEEAERPEGSLKNLAAEFTSDARWESANILGSGLYADAKVFGGFKDAVDELAPHIGVSIRGYGVAEDGEAEGKEGKIINRIAGRDSVDFVTMPGAGGKILQLFESARPGSSTLIVEDDMKELEELKEAKKQLEADLQASKDATIAAEKAKTEAEAESAKLKEVVLLRQAKDFVGGKLAEAELPDLTKDRLVESLSKNPPVKDGALDEETYATSIDEAVKEHVEYLAKIVGSGVIKGMGASGDTAGAEEGREALKESYKAKFESEGKSPEEAERMAEIAAKGR